MVYVFKTSVTTKVAVKKLAPLLNQLPFMRKWNIDFQDCDKILRIEEVAFDPKIVCDVLKSCQCNCIELE